MYLSSFTANKVLSSLAKLAWIGRMEWVNG